MKVRKLDKQSKTKINAQNKGMVLFTLLCILLFYPPFFKGLFFQKEILITHILSFGLFIIYLVNKATRGEKIKLNTPFDYIGLLFIGAYILPIIFRQWADLREAMGLILRYTNFYVVYIMVKDYAGEEKYMNWILDIFILSGVVTAIIGLLGAGGYVNLQDVVLGNRISSTFQYPNTLAAFLMTLFFITIAKQIKADLLWEKTLYGIVGFIMVFTFIFTYSRTAWVLFPIFAIGYFLIAPKTAKADILLYYVGVATPSILLLQPFSKYTSNIEGRSPKAVGIIIIGIIGFTGIYVILQKFKEKLQAKHLKLIYMLIGLAIIGMGVFGTYALNATQALVFDNLAVTENKHNTIQRLVKKIEPNQDYSLEIDLNATENREEGQWPWRIRIVSINGDGERISLLTRNAEPGEEGQVLIPFTTNEDTRGLAISFDNLYPGTKVVYNEAVLLDDSSQVLNKIKLSYKYIPETIIERLNVLDLGQRSFTTRVAYYRDSFKIYKDYPIIGAGGGAWEGLYTIYQSEPYFSTEAHNYFLQTLVELGTVGILLLASLIGTIVFLFIIFIKKKDLTQMTILFSILSLLTHSGLDFNFSYLSIPLFMWALLALVDTQPTEDIKIGIKDKFNREIHSLIPLILTLPFIVAATSFYGGYQSATSGVYALQMEQDFQKGYELMTRAIGTDPFNKSYRGDLARLQIMIGEQNQDQAWFQAAGENLQTALKYAPYDDNILQQTGLFYISHGQFDKGFEYIEKLTQISPLRPASYDTKINAYTVVGKHYLDTGEKNKAVEMFEKAVEVVENIKATNEKAERTIVLNQESMNAIFKARYTLENINDKDQLAKLEDTAYISYLDVDVDADGSLDDRWRIANSADGNAHAEIIENGTLITNDGEDHGIFLSPRFALQPSTTYGIDLKIRGDVNDEYAQLLVRSANGTSTQLSQRPIGEPTEDNIYSFTFETTEDIEPGPQEIRLYHYGNSDREFTVQQIILYEIE